MSPAARESVRPDATRIGRRVAAAMYWLLTVYVIGAGFVSVVPQVFWPARALGVVQDEGERPCGPLLRALHDDLVAGTSELVAHARGGAARAFLEGWTARLHALEGRCETHPAYRLLARRRHRLEEHLLRLEADEAALGAETIAALERDPGNAP